MGSKKWQVVGYPIRNCDRLYPLIYTQSLTLFFFLFSLDQIMPKLTAKAAKKTETKDEMRAFGPLFNKDLGQHILKNPLVAQGIVDKVKCQIIM